MFMNHELLLLWRLIQLIENYIVIKNIVTPLETFSTLIVLTINEALH